jgi:hypothetical protein
MEEEDGATPLGARLLLGREDVSLELPIAYLTVDVDQRLLERL